jgi:hypothetical protein
MLAR